MTNKWLLDGPRARRAFLLSILLDPALVRAARGDAAVGQKVVRGHLWVSPTVPRGPTANAVRLNAGDVVVSVVATMVHRGDPGTPTQVVIGPDAGPPGRSTATWWSRRWPRACAAGQQQRGRAHAVAGATS